MLVLSAHSAVCAHSQLLPPLDSCVTHASWFGSCGRRWWSGLQGVRVHSKDLWVLQAVTVCTQEAVSRHHQPWPLQAATRE